LFVIYRNQNPFAMKTILVNLHSLSEQKEYMMYALELARDLDRIIQFVYVINPAHYVSSIPGPSGSSVEIIPENITLVKQKIDESSEKMKASIDELRSAVSKPPAMDFMIPQGLTSKLIKEISSDKNIDMVMVEGDKTENVFNDSNFDIIRETSCPVWVIPKGMKYKSFSEIVYTSDYNEEDIPTLKKLTGIAKNYSAHITALHITTDLDFEEKVRNPGFRKLIIDQTGYDQIDVKTLVEKKHDKIADIVTDYASSFNTDLIVVLKENKNFFERIFRGSSTKELINRTSLPLLIYHEKAV
jgi:nucleotide-binding universal stress UspA family protein